MTKVKCPDCGKEVNIITFGNGLVAACCGKIIYRKDRNARHENIKERAWYEIA